MMYSTGLQDYWLDPDGYPPPVNEYVLLRCYDDADDASEVHIGRLLGYQSDTGNWWSTEDFLKVTGWMPLPKT